MTPAKFVERARVERARRVLEDDSAPMESVAAACGFGSAERMRRSFQRQLRVVPDDYRKRFERPAQRRRA
jgi:transcriptional regulator GlxA family with amidase domain